MREPEQTVRCPRCASLVGLREDGTMRTHPGRYDWEKRRVQECRGSGERPA